MDIIGPLQVTDRGNQYIVALTDHFTKFPVAKAIPCKSSEEVARFMYETICIFGAFDSLITDQGREFINFALDILTDRFNINHRISSAYHPETNGQRERDNRTLKDTLVKITDNDDWDELLPAALFAYRTSVHKSTQFSPFLALYGEQAKLPFDVTGDANEQDLNEEIMDTMKGIHEEVKNKIGENISRAQKKQKEYYDSRRAYDHGFRIGDKVLIINAARVHRMGGKMAPRFVGPYEEWGITELPALIYFRDGIEEPDFFLGDVTVDDITDEIARRLHGNFGGLERYYAVEVTSNNFREIVKTPKQSVLLLVYDKNSLNEVQIIEQVAKLFRNDDAFGGNISIFMLTTFINEQTGLNRNPDGSMQPTSGRVEQFDKHVADSADDIMKGNKEAVGRLVSHLLIEKPKLRRHELEFANYYVFLLDKITASGKMDVVDTQLNDIMLKLDEHEDLLPKQEDTLKRKRNILLYFKNLSSEVAKRKEEERKKKELERQIKEKQEKLEEEKRKREAEEEKRRGRKGAPGKRKTAQPSQYTAQATIHRRAHEEL
nr:hypothetical protein BaRGS_003855 [Batillaria attramentaria]